MRLRLKLLTPTLLAAGLAIGGILSLSLLDQRIADQAESDRVMHTRAAFADGIQDRQRETSNAADLLAHNWRFIDDVAVNQLDRITDALSPMHDELAISFIAVYDAQGRVMVRGDHPERFGQTDDLLPLVRESLAGRAPPSAMALRDDRILVLSQRRLVSGTTTLGVLLVGMELDQDYVDNFSADHLVHLVFTADHRQVLASRGWEHDHEQGGDWVADPLPIPLLIDSQVEATCWRNIAADEAARHHHLLLIIALALGSAGLIAMSHRLVTGTVASLDRARRAAEAAERRVAEIEARRHDAFLQGMIADSPIACVVVDGHAGTVLYANRRFAQMWGVSEPLDELRGRMSIDRLSQQCAPRAADPQAFASSLANLADPQVREVIEDEVVLADGRITKRFSAPIRDAEDHPLGRVFLFEDITARKQHERALIRAKNAAEEAQAASEAAARAKGDFLSVMSHELRTPLNGVIGLGHVLAESKLNPEQRECIDTIVECGHHLLSVINDILDFSKLDAGKMTVETVTYAPRELVDGVVALVAAQAKGKGLGMLVEIEPQIPERLTGDPQRIRQILLNLLANAVKFTEHGQVTLRLRLLGDRLQFAVVDTGIGIPAEAQARLFAPFIQVDSSTSRRYGGTGLGLAISRRLAELMGGGISLASRPGMGSVFTLDLPFSYPIQRATSPHQRPVADPRPPSLSGLRILVVEDDAVNRMVAERILESLGCLTAIVANGERALAYQAQHAPEESIDIVLMDLQMPDMDGYTCAQRWREAETERDWRRTPILALSAAASDEDIAAAIAAGMNGHIAKPINSAELAQKLQPWAIVAGCLPA
jgi:PAS domain S-box-containing protein